MLIKNIKRQFPSLMQYKSRLLNWKYLDVSVLMLLFFFGFLLRIYQIDRNLFFGPEQGRDLLVVKDIVINHKLVLIGPRTAVDGIFHGPLYYYLAVIPFLISKGSPLAIEIFFVLINSLSVFLVYLLGKALFNRKVALISSLLLTFSFGSIVMSRWLSHPPLIIPISCLFFIFLVRFIKGKDLNLIPAAIFFCLACQAEFTDFLIFSFVLLLIIICFWKRFLKQNLVYLIISLGILFVGAFGNFLLFDLRHNFLITNSFVKLLTKHSGFYGTFTNSFLNSINIFIQVFYELVAPFYVPLAVLILILGLFSLIRIVNKNRISVYLLLIWIFSPFIAFVLLKYNPLYHYFAAVSIALIILTAVLVERLLSVKQILGVGLAVLLVLINFAAFCQYLPINKNVFFQTTQPDLRYSDQASVIREIYKQANGKPFYFQSYTIPYWLQEEWEYLFWYYGSNTYGYVPVDKQAKTLFVIIQDDPSNQLYQNNWLKNTVLGWGTKENEFRFGALRVEKLAVK